MNVSMVRSDGIYAKIASAPAGKKDDIYRFTTCATSLSSGVPM